VINPDSRWRPEYLGGGSSPVNMHPIAKTSSTDATSPQGNLAAMATSSKTGDGFVKSFTEHCVLIGMCSVRADLNYQQGLHRQFSRSTRYDFYFPSLSHLGEQAVLTKEIYCKGTADDETVFGYIPRFEEYRFKPSQITGLFRSTAASNIDQWHLAQEFSALPELNESFIEENVPMERIKSVDAEPDFYLDVHFKFRATRPMAMFGIPKISARL